jgi:ribosome biogenesis GTPase / thiamine phosphate phosphatase
MSRRWVGCDLEAEYFGEDRKLGKQQRKTASAKDRSKYKKTDQDKLQKQEIKPPAEHLLKGRVLSITPQSVIVDHEGETFDCSLRGLLKKEKSQFKNLVTVGDFVRFEKTSDKEGLIFHVEPRHSILSRADNLSRRKEQLIASNIDQVMITCSVVLPPLKPFLVDRYIIAARKGGMQPIIVVNKIDLLEDPTVDPIIRESEKELLELFIQAYDIAKVPVILMSHTTGDGLDKLCDAMQNKASVFSGQSGVGKSSLINAITGHTLAVGKVVERTKKGAQTTTTAHLLPLKFGGWCIDTPGIKSFGVWDLKHQEVESYFVEIHAAGLACKFPDCSHVHEEDCAVMQAIERGEISALRYQSYLYLMHSLADEHKRR